MDHLAALKIGGMSPVGRILGVGHDRVVPGSFPHFRRPIILSFLFIHLSFIYNPCVKKFSLRGASSHCF